MQGLILLFPSEAVEHMEGDRFGGLVKKKKKRLGGRIAQLAGEGEYNRTKSSSTSTLFINSTVSTPDVDELLRSASIKICYHIKMGLESKEKVYLDIFDERIHRLDNGVPDTDKVPSVDDIYQFISIIFDTEQLSAECAIMTLAYIERAIKLTGLTVDASNWRRVVLSTLILASKVWEDQAVWNVDFCSVFPHVTATDLAQLEKVLLRLLQFNVSLKSSDYTKYYFELREFAERDSRNFPLKPLDKAGAQKLESRSASEEEKARARMDTEKLPRSRSLDELQNSLKSPRVVLN